MFCTDTFILAISPVFTKTISGVLFKPVTYPLLIRNHVTSVAFMAILSFPLLRATRLRHCDQQLLLPCQTGLLHQGPGFGEGTQAAAQTGRTPSQGHHEHQPEPSQGRTLLDMKCNKVIVLYQSHIPLMSPQTCLENILYYCECLSIQLHHLPI